MKSLIRNFKGNQKDEDLVTIPVTDEKHQTRTFTIPDLIKLKLKFIRMKYIFIHHQLSAINIY